MRFRHNVPITSTLVASAALCLSLLDGARGLSRGLISLLGRVAATMPAVSVLSTATASTMTAMGLSMIALSCRHTSRPRPSILEKQLSILFSDEEMRHQGVIGGNLHVPKLLSNYGGPDAKGTQCLLDFLGLGDNLAVELKGGDYLVEAVVEEDDDVKSTTWRVIHLFCAGGQKDDMLAVEPAVEAGPELRVVALLKVAWLRSGCDR